MIVRTGSYMYSDGDGQTARDPLNHALPLLFFAPNATKSGIRVAIASTHNTHWRGGRIPKATYGFGLGFAVGNDRASAHDRDAWCCYPSDLELWILQAAVRYVLTHRDWAFLTESVRSTWGEIKVADALWRISHHLLEVSSSQGGVGLGPHGLLKVLTMDYNDGILLGPNSSMNVHTNNLTAESGLNSAMAVGILRGYSDVLSALPPTVARELGDVTANVSHLKALAQQQERAVSKTFGGSWFARMWAPDSGWFGTETNASIWWSNAFPLLNMIPPVDAPQPRQRLVDSIEAGLLEACQTGVPFSNFSSHADYQQPWFAASMYMLEALGTRGYQELAGKTWQKGLLSCGNAF